MPDSPGPFKGVRDVSRDVIAGESQSLGSLDPDTSTSLSDSVFDNVPVGQPPPLSSTIVEEPEIQEASQATLECMRGPCFHSWRMITRLESMSEILNIHRIQYCTHHVELMDLNDQNAYECGQWWPSFLVFVPESLRPLLRPFIRELWDFVLKRQGYDFDSWRWWPRNVWDMTPDQVDDLRTAAVLRSREARRRARSNGTGDDDATA